MDSTSNRYQVTDNKGRRFIVWLTHAKPYIPTSVYRCVRQRGWKGAKGRTTLRTIFMSGHKVEPTARRAIDLALAVADH